MKLKDKFSQKGHKLEINKLDKNFRPHFALTGHSTQGITTNKTLNIFDVEHRFMTAKWLWCAITRTTDLNKINLIIRHGDFNLKYNLDRMIIGYKEQDIFASREFNENDFITAKDIKQMYEDQNGKCIGCKEQMNLISNKYDPSNVTCDRIDNNISHVKGNIVLNCLRCNCSKK